MCVFVFMGLCNGLTYENDRWRKAIALQKISLKRKSLITHTIARKNHNTHMWEYACVFAEGFCE